MKPSSFESAERLLKIAQSDVCYEWLFGDESGEKIAAQMFGSRGVAHRAAASALDFGDCDGDTGGYRASQSRLSYVPTPQEMARAVVSDADYTSLQENLCSAYVPQGTMGRYVLGTLFTNACIIPFRPGVTAWPAYRFVGYRMRNGYGHVCVGQDSAGVPVVALVDVLDSGKESVEIFHNLRLEGSRIVFDHVAVMETAVFAQRVSGFGEATLNGSGSNSLARVNPNAGVSALSLQATQSTPQPKKDLFTAEQLDEPIDWNKWATFFVEAREHVRENNPLFTAAIRNGQGDDLYTHVAPTSMVAILGRDYVELPKLNALFFGRVSNVSAPRRSVPLGLYKLLGVDDEPRSEADDNSKSSSSLVGRHPPSAQNAGPTQTGGADSQTSAICPECGKVLSRVNELRRHIRTVHFREKSHKCSHCDKMFSQSSHLVTHIRTVHEGRMDYNCETCGRKFAVRSNLVKHERRMQGRCVADSTNRSAQEGDGDGSVSLYGTESELVAPTN
ncbi:Zinc finger protein [Porphyridium purpureum]|uniref:Zinc finger protein n=1 Tax=Porphyridium purpureum TaxID=35688 RepID=A0A5J4YY15_PORPP|nr:Zinc finger protein [Porphyridium purpureum]|eukprot:POR4950..scf209_3